MRVVMLPIMFISCTYERAQYVDRRPAQRRGALAAAEGERIKNGESIPVNREIDAAHIQKHVYTYTYTYI